MEPQNTVQVPTFQIPVTPTPKPNFKIPFLFFLIGLIFGTSSLYLTEKYILKPTNINTVIPAEAGIHPVTPTISTTPSPTTIIPTQAIPTITAKTTPTPIKQPKTGWTTYTNDKYKFSFDYPYQYVLQEISGSDFGYAPGNSTLAYFVNNDKQQLMVSLDDHAFDLSYLRKYSPTGQDDFEPAPIPYSSFYYFGPGGGGVCYPDQYFTKFGNKTIIITFDGCTNDKTPPAITKEIASQLLATFKTL